MPISRTFDWLSRHDPRSRAFGIAEVHAAVEPRAKYWVPGHVLDQGAEGNCVGYGCALDCSSSPVRIPEVDDYFADELFREARQIDRDADRYWPDGASVLAGAKALRARGFIEEFRWAFGVEQLRDALIAEGPAILGVSWYEAMYETEPSGLVDIDGPLVGGHCITVHGYSPRARINGLRGTHEVFRWQNSWGPGYGVGGRGIVRIEDMDRLLADSGEACIPMWRRNPAADVVAPR